MILSILEYNNNIHIAALIMTGGRNNGADLNSVEVYVPSTNTFCSLPPLPVTTYEHTQDGLLLCGGDQCPPAPAAGRCGHKAAPVPSEMCHTYFPVSGLWIETHPLHERRSGHSSWQREDGTVLLMGGWYSPNTTEIVSDSSAVSTPGFSLKYYTL